MRNKKNGFENETEKNFVPFLRLDNMLLLTDHTLLQCPGRRVGSGNLVTDGDSVVAVIRG
jgi:hypothetical protein